MVWEIHGPRGKYLAGKYTAIEIPGKFLAGKFLGVNHDFKGIFGNFSVFLSFVGFFAEWLAFCPPLLSHVDVFHFLWAASLPPPVTGGEI